MPSQREKLLIFHLRFAGGRDVEQQWHLHAAEAAHSAFRSRAWDEENLRVH